MDPQNRKKYTSHTLSVKLKAIRDYEEGDLTPEQIASNLEVDESTVRKWIKNKNNLKEWNQNFFDIPKKRKRLSTPIHYRLDRAMWLWFSQKRSTGVSICGASIKDKAKQFYDELGGTEKFTASNGWLRCWKKRYDIRSETMSGERLSTNIDAVEPFKTQFLNYVKSNNLTVDQVFNCDRTVLNYKLLPNSIYSALSEPSPSDLEGYDERLTVMACSNVSGNLKLPLTVIGKSAKPRASKKVPLPVSYKSQRNAWMTNDLFSEWFDDDFVPLVLKFLSKKGLPPKALLLMDKCAAHKTIDSKNGITVMYLPPNTTSLIQPMAQGCLQNFEVLYKAQLMKFIVEKKDEEFNLTKVMKKITVKDSILWAAEAWNNVYSSTIQNSWNKVWPEEERTIDESNVENSRNLEAVTASFCNSLQKDPAYRNINPQQINAWLHPQFKHTQHECLTDTEILQVVMDEFPETDAQCDDDETEESQNLMKNSSNMIPASLSRPIAELCLKYTKDYCCKNNCPPEIIQKLNDIENFIRNSESQEE